MVSNTDLTLRSLSPVTTWAFQELGVALGLIVLDRPKLRLVAAMMVMIASVLLTFWAGRQARGAPDSAAVRR